MRQSHRDSGAFSNAASRLAGRARNLTPDSRTRGPACLFRPRITSGLSESHPGGGFVSADLAIRAPPSPVGIDSPQGRRMSWLVPPFGTELWKVPLAFPSGLSVQE